MQIYTCQIALRSAYVTVRTFISCCGIIWKMETQSEHCRDIMLFYFKKREEYRIILWEDLHGVRQWCCDRTETLILQVSFKSFFSPGDHQSFDGHKVEKVVDENRRYTMGYKMIISVDSMFECHMNLVKPILYWDVKIMICFWWEWLQGIKVNSLQ